MASSTWDLILLVLSFFLPPLGVFFKAGLHSEFWISILLTILGHIPGVLYSWWVILSKRNISYHYVPTRYATSSLNQNFGNNDNNDNHVINNGNNQGNKVAYPPPMPGSHIHPVHPVVIPRYESEPRNIKNQNYGSLGRMESQSDGYLHQPRPGENIHVGNPSSGTGSWAHGLN